MKKQEESNMTPSELQQKGGIYFDKIQQGMSEYAWESKFFSSQMAKDYIRNLWKENGDEHSFVDCYYKFLEKESKDRILQVLTEEQQKYLQELEKNQQDLLVPLTEELLNLAVDLTDKEMLFFTFYFLKNPCTIWGNYKQEYVLFYPKQEACYSVDYDEDAENVNNLEIEENIKPVMEKMSAEMMQDILNNIAMEEKVSEEDMEPESFESLPEQQKKESKQDECQNVLGDNSENNELKEKDGEKKHMKIFAHRGFSGKYPENTMLAFHKAYEVGCDGIELDVQMTKDGVLVIMHDETIDRTTNGKGNLRDYTYEELCQFDCYGAFKGEYEFQKIPTLREYLEWVKPTGLLTNIELKNSVYYYEGLEEKVFEMVKELEMENQILFSSFNLVSVLKCKNVMPQIPAGFLTETKVDNMGAFAKEYGVDYYHPGLDFLTEEVVENCHAHGRKVNVWTVNKKKEMKQMAKWKVDGIFTNYPNKAKKLKED